MNLISLDRAREVLTPYVPQMVASLRDSVDGWNSDLGILQAAMDAPARALILNRLFYFNAARRLAGAGDAVEFRESRAQRYLLFNDEIIVRFKLFDDRLERRNYPTRHATNWVRQTTLPGILPVSRLHFGYRLDVSGSVITDAFITLPNGDRLTVNSWVWQVYGEPINAFGFQERLFGGEVFRYDDFSKAI